MVEIVFYDGIQMPENAIKAKFCSKALANNDAPADGNISQLSFFIDSQMDINFISKRRFTTGPVTYKDKDFIERAGIKIIDQGLFFSIRNLYKMSSRHNNEYSAEIRLPEGTIFLSNEALKQLRETINTVHKEALLAREKAAQKVSVQDQAKRAAARKKAAREAFISLIATGKVITEKEKVAQKEWIDQKRASCVELVFGDGIEASDIFDRGKYYSQKLTNCDGKPIHTDISNLTFFVDNKASIDFISERYFKHGPQIYKEKTYTERGKIEVVDRENSFSIKDLYKNSSWNKEWYSAKIHLPTGIILLSDDALTKLLEAINNAHRDVLISRKELAEAREKAIREKAEAEARAKAAEEKTAREAAAREQARRETARKKAAREAFIALIAQRKANFHAALQTISEWQAAWNEYPECYQKVIRFAQMEAVEILLNADYLARFESYLLSQWIKGSPYEKKAQGLLQTDSENLSVAHSPIQQFPVLVELVARECQWDDNYAACRIYGAFLHYIKSESVNQCEIIYGFTLQDKWSYKDCLKQYVQTAGTNSNDETRFSQFVYYMIVKNHVPIPDEENALPYHLGFEYAYHKIKEDISPYITEYLENAAIMKLDHLLSETQQSQSLTIEDFDLMSGVEFEQAISDLFKRMDYQVTTTPTTGDQGIDIIAVRGETRLGIQAKCYSGKVGNAAVQEVVAGVKYYNLNRCMVVTNSTFTASAIRLAKANNVVLWDRNILKEKIEIID